MKKRVFLVVMDSAGIGGAPDAEAFGDKGANTIGHIIEYMRDHGSIRIPHLARLGLGAALEASVNKTYRELSSAQIGFAGAAREISNGKDTPSGHWEIAGVPVPWDWHYFPNQTPCFSEKLRGDIYAQTGTEFIGLKHASGTAIIDELGVTHIKSGKPIAYTSVDSVFQIAAHEKTYGLDRLYALCESVAKIVHPMRVGRVIARPFIGEENNFKRTSNRHDYAIEPPSDTILDRAMAVGHHTIGIGKIRDIFSMRGLQEVHAGMPDRDLFDKLDHALETAPNGSLIFANFVEFDSLFGHPRNPIGYARALEWFDERLGNFTGNMRDNDMLIVTADHGNDPTWHGNDHTREQVPVLGYSPVLEARDIGQREFSDIGASVLDYLGIGAGPSGKSFL